MAKLHEIKFDSFYEKITDIGSKRKKTWFEIINAELESEIQEAKKRKLENIKDITDRKKINEELQESLSEKEILLQEIHHRVKNNLQIIIALLELKKENTKNDESYDILMESVSRIKSMALENSAESLRT